MSQFADTTTDPLARASPPAQTRCCRGNVPWQENDHDQIIRSILSEITLKNEAGGVQEKPNAAWLTPPCLKNTLLPWEDPAKAIRRGVQVPVTGCQAPVKVTAWYLWLQVDLEDGSVGTVMRVQQRKTNILEVRALQ